MGACREIQDLTQYSCTLIAEHYGRVCIVRTLILEYHAQALFPKTVFSDPLTPTSTAVYLLIKAVKTSLRWSGGAAVMIYDTH